VNASRFVIGLLVLERSASIAKRQLRQSRATAR
jgi:hypothetical protein